MNKNYKEIIYLNEKELNSALSQLNQGVLESLVETKNNSKGTTKEAEKSSKAGVGFGHILNIGINASDKDTQQLNSLFGEEKNIILNDFKLNVLINDSKPKTLETSKEGDFILVKGKFNIQDFDFSETVLQDPKSSALNPKLKNFMRDIDAWDNSTEKGFKILNHYIQYVNSLALGNLVLSMDGVISFIDKNNFRINSGALQALHYTSRSINVLGIVEAIMENNEDEAGTELSNMFDKSSDVKNTFENIGKIIPKLTELTFLTTHLMNKGDKFIRPIALYFD